MAMSLRASRAERGFSLIELLLVLLLLAGVTALAGVALGPARDGGVIAARSRATLVWLETLRGQAVRLGRTVGARLDEEARMLSPIGVSLEPLPLDVGADIAAAGGAARGEIMFFADGRSNGATLRLAHKGRQSRIELDGLTGRMRLRDDITGG